MNISHTVIFIARNSSLMIRARRIENNLLGSKSGLTRSAYPPDENPQILERSAHFFPLRRGRSSFLDGASNRTPSHGKRAGGNRPDRIHHHYDSLRSPYASSSQTSCPITLPELSEHDEAMDFGTARERTPKLTSHSSILRRRQRRAFTLVELLTVIAIIITLMGLTVGVQNYASRKATETRIKSEIHAMELALEAYKEDFGTYPPWDQTVAGTNTSFTSTELTSKSAGWSNITYVYRALSATNDGKVYMTFKRGQLFSTSSVVYIVDPNGNPYGYNIAAPLVNKQSFDLFSAGLDNTPSYTPTGVNQSTNDDIGNWNL